MSDDINELGGSNIPKGVQFPSIGTKHVILVDEVKKVPVREFIAGKPADQLFFQNRKKVRQSDLNLQLPFEPIPAWLVVGQLKDGTPVSLRLESERLKATKKAIRDGGRLAAGGMIAIEYVSDDPDSTGPFPKKLYAVQLKGPKTDA